MWLRHPGLALDHSASISSAARFHYIYSTVSALLPPLQAAGLKSAPSPPEPNVVCPNGPKECAAVCLSVCPCDR